jgi:transcriptional regulator
MYTPKQFQENDPKLLLDFMRRYSFASLVSTHEGEPFATHIPFLVEERADQIVLIGHMARANPQWKSFSNQKVLTIFTGPHCYVSPAWYYPPGEDPQANQRNHVPTWNYTAVHIYGTPTLVEGSDAVHALLHRLVDHFESPEAKPWTMKLPDEYRLNLQSAIVAFEIVATRIEGKFKLNQNRKLEERDGVVQALSKKTSENEQGVYQLMRDAQEKEPRG